MSRWKERDSGGWGEGVEQSSWHSRTAACEGGFELERSWEEEEEEEANEMSSGLRVMVQGFEFRVQSWGVYWQGWEEGSSWRQIARSLSAGCIHSQRLLRAITCVASCGITAAQHLTPTSICKVNRVAACNDTPPSESFKPTSHASQTNLAYPGPSNQDFHYRPPASLPSATYSMQLATSPRRCMTQCHKEAWKPHRRCQSRTQNAPGSS